MNRSEQAAAYALGELSGAEGAAFEARLAEDAKLRREVDALRATMASLGQLPAEAWPGGEWTTEGAGDDRLADERPERAERPEIQLLKIVRRRLDRHLELIIVLQPERVVAVASVGGPTARLYIGRGPRLGTDGPQEGRGMKGAGSHRHVVGLQNDATLR